MSSTTPNLGLFKYNTSTDGKEVFSIQNALNNNWDIIDEKCGSGKNIGEIVVSTLPLTDAGLHLLDGSLIQGDGAYSAFVTYMVGLKTTYPDLFITEASWQEAVSTYGVCGKFVHDSTNNTIRLPKYNDKIYTSDITSTVPVIGNGKAFGVTDSVQEMVFVQSHQGNTNTPHMSTSGLGENYGKSLNGDYWATTSGKSIGVVTDSTKSGLIAQLSNITTSLDGYYYIVIATSTKTNIQIDIDEIATDLNGKCDKADLMECQVVIETYQNGTSWYRVWSDGWCEQGGNIPIRSGNSWQTVNLLKSFANTNYTVTLAITGVQNNTEAQALSYKTTGSFQVYAWVSRGNDWYACGYIEV